MTQGGLGRPPPCDEMTNNSLGWLVLGLQESELETKSVLICCCFVC